MSLQLAPDGEHAVVASLVAAEPAFGDFSQSAIGAALLESAHRAGAMHYVLREKDAQPLFVSEPLLAIFQLSLPELHRNPDAWYARLQPGVCQEVKGMHRIVRSTGHAGMTYRIVDGAGRTRTLQDSAVLVRGVEPAVIIGTVLDLTPLSDLDVLAKDRLQGLEQSKEGFALTDPEGRFTYMNPEHLHMFGYRDFAEVQGQPWTILYEPDEVQEISGEVFPVLMAQRQWHGVRRAKRKDGSTFSEDLTLSILPNGGIACNCRDRTVEIELQERQAHSEKLFRGFAELLPSGVFIKRLDGSYTFVNHQVAGFLGTTPASLTGKRDSDVFPPEVMHTIRRADEQVLRTGQVAHYEISMTHGGRAYDFVATKFPLANARGQIEYLCSIYTDVTRQKELERGATRVTERQAELIRMQHEFVSLISHEFRTPLTAIQGAYFLLRKCLDPNPDERVQRYLGLQGESIAAMKNLLEQVLYLNRLDHRSGELQPKPVRVSQRLTALVERLNSDATLPAPRVELGLRLPPETEASLDESLFDSAVQNVISNALKYSPADTKVAVEATVAGPDLCVRIEDRGRGIPAAEQPKIFSAFFRARNVGAIPGTGLGLTIAKRAVDLHRGRIEFASTENQGTVFRLLFPLSPRS